MPVKQGLPWYVLRICIVVGLLSLWLLLQLNIEKSDFTLFVPHTRTDGHFTNDTSSLSGFLVNTNGCRIPDLDIMEASIRKYLYDEDPINCEKKYGPALVESNVTHLFLNESVLNYYNVSEASQLYCCYTPFWREEVEETSSRNYPANVDTNIKFANTCVEFSEPVIMNYEFVKTECFANNNSIYLDFHAFTPLKKENESKEEFHSEHSVSVLIIGVDAVSRLNLHRTMPLTVKFLKQRLKAVEMLGYNKVEDNTFPNLVPVLTGLSENELKDSCWQSAQSVFDNCSFIWDNFSDIGYKTAFAEDASWMGIFNYVKRGFRKQPTDYYMSIYNKVSEERIGFEKRLNAHLCVGPRKSLVKLLNYAYKFATTMKDFLSFGFFWGASLSHDYLNLPKQGDKDHKQFLENLYNQGIFNNTVLVFMSDHGIRWGDIRKTYQGYVEERLPFLFIAYPEWFRVKYTTAVSNLNKNTQKLTTPFDLHEVLLDLTNLTRLDREDLRIRSEELEKSKPLPRGISLFIPVPESRTCLDSGIIEHWCTCHQSSKVLTNDTNVRHAANHLVNHVNSLLKGYPQCAKLKLNKIINAMQEKTVAQQTFDVGIRDFSLTVETTPGKALFEATVRHNPNLDTYVVVGSISRINLYGNQSKCVPQYKLRLYCYCVSSYF